MELLVVNFLGMGEMFWGFLKDNDVVNVGLRWMVFSCGVFRDVEW